MRDKGEQSGQRKMKRVQKLCARMPIAGGILALIIGIVFLVRSTGGAEKEDGSFIERIKPEFRAEPIVSAAEQFPDLDIQEEFLTVNPYSRPGTELKNVKKIVIHYTANPGTSAQANRDYFEGLATTRITSASSHFIIGLDGEIIQCVPMYYNPAGSLPRNPGFRDSIGRSPICKAVGIPVFYQNTSV